MTGLALLATLSTAVAAQQTWVVDPRKSLAWWEVNPHMGHLWATTCPGEPSWRAGAPRGRGPFHHLPWFIEPGAPQVHKTQSAIDSTFSSSWHGAALSDTTDIPLYPRRRVRPVCTEALDGRVLVVHANAGGGFSGQITVRADRLTMGSDSIDQYVRVGVLHVRAHPQVKFTIDSVVRITERGDTVHGTAMGILTLRGVAKPIAASVRFWNDTAAGGLRVLAKTHIPVRHLWSEFGMSEFALGSIGAHTWQDVWMGVDLVMKPDSAR
jgi:YceI-like protein